MADSESAPRAKKRGVLLPVAAGLAALLCAGAAAWMYSSRSAEAGRSSGAVAFTLPLDTFVVNLNGTDRGYLRVGVALGLARMPSHREDVPVALARDVILSVLSGVKEEELAPPQGKDRLKGEVLRALQERAPQIGVVDVYITEMLVQM